MFRDKIHLEVSSGNGGNGVISFRKEKNVPRGGPDGGDGGRGGSVYLIATPIQSHLVHLNKMHYRASHGKNGEGGNRKGHDGENICIQVPLNTQVWVQVGKEELDVLLNTISQPRHKKIAFGKVPSEVSIGTNHLTDRQSTTNTTHTSIQNPQYKTEKGKYYILLKDLFKPEKYCIAEGGKGGVGNTQYATSTNQAPQFCKQGVPGITRTIQLRMRLAAHFGLIGAPNAGKSSLLRTLSNATPEVASYKFTTINPQIGITPHNSSVIDIPGLIEGAHANKGLGHAFLDHIAKCSTLICVLDITDNPEIAYGMLINELQAFDPELIPRIKLVVLNKIDLLDDSSSHQFSQPDFGVPVIHTSTVNGTGIDQLLDYLHLPKDPSLDEITL